MWSTTTEQKAHANTNWPLLAGIRFLLAMIVLLSHMGGYTNYKPLVYHHKNMVDLAHYIGSLGAVMAFFMISGYSIAHSITNRPEKFIIRRIWRIWPTYLFCYLVFVLPIAIYEKNRIGQIIGNALLMQGYLTPVIEVHAASWSLAIEEGLYLLSPLFRRASDRLLIFLITFSSFLYLLSPSLNWNRFAGEIAGRGFICCAWAWLIGFLYYRNFNKKWAQALLLFLPVLLLGACNQLPGTIQCTVVLSVAIALIYGPSVTIASERVNKSLAWLGNISYQVYICHAPFATVVCLALTSLGFSKDLWAAHPYLSISSVMIASAAIYHFIDAPNRDRWKSMSFSNIWKKSSSKQIEEQNAVI